MEDHTQLKNALSNRGRIIEIINHPSINANLIISVMNVIFVNQIRDSDVVWKITSL